MPNTTLTKSAGDLLRHWRQHRRLSQLGLATDADISQRHLSFVESGRAQPSRDMILLLADHLAIPLRERNEILIAAGFAPLYRERPLEHPSMSSARAAVDLVLKSHEPFPALAVDRHWTLIAANAPVQVFLEGAAPQLIQQPVNVLRLSLHPDGLGPRIVNYRAWRAHVLKHLDRQIDISADPILAALRAELAAYPVPIGATPPKPPTAIEATGVVVPLQLKTPTGVLSFFSTITMFGTPIEVTLSELAIEQFFPADEATAAYLRNTVTQSAPAAG